MTNNPENNKWEISMSPQAIEQLMGLIADDPEMAQQIEEAFKKLEEDPFANSERFCVECDKWIVDHENHPHFESLDG